VIDAIMRGGLEQRRPEPAQPQRLPNEIDDVVEPDFRPTAAEI
jgi:hypothetical protein